eukprot:XP_011663088.1 PREDICTED: uncharacterized protein LOC100891023 isoform X1 [Strongylocentrotus purpuratus]
MCLVAFVMLLPRGTGKTFSETRAYCQSLGGDMPIITSVEQNDFIANTMSFEEGNGRYYIGLEKMDDGTYRWIDGTALAGYKNWDYSHLYERPDLPPYCAVMRSRSGDTIHGLWYLVTCTSTRRPICQIPSGIPIGMPIVPTPSLSPSVSSPPKTNSTGVPSGPTATVVGSTVSSPPKSNPTGVPSGPTATVVGSAVGAIVVIVIVIILIIFYKRRSDESATTSSPQVENPVFDQSETNVHTYLDPDTASQSYAYPTNHHIYQDTI